MQTQQDLSPNHANMEGRRGLGFVAERGREHLQPLLRLLLRLLLLLLMLLLLLLLLLLLPLLLLLLLLLAAIEWSSSSKRDVQSLA